MDKHEPHLSLKALHIAKESDDHVLTLYPQTFDKLQPLAIRIYGPFMTYYNAAIDARIYNIGEIVGGAFLKVMTPDKIKKAFKSCGILPVNRNISNDHDLLSIISY